MILPAVLYVLALVGFPFCLSVYLALSGMNDGVVFTNND